MQSLVPLNEVSIVLNSLVVSHFLLSIRRAFLRGFREVENIISFSVSSIESLALRRSLGECVISPVIFNLDDACQRRLHLIHSLNLRLSLLGNVNTAKISLRNLLSQMSLLLFNVKVIDLSCPWLRNLICKVEVAFTGLLRGNNLGVVHVNLVYTIVEFSAKRH